MLAAVLLVFAALTILSFYTSVSGLFKAELFPARVRALGVRIGHAIASEIFGGTAEYVALLLKQWGTEGLFGWYVSAICVVSFLVEVTMLEPRAQGHLPCTHAMRSFLYENDPPHCRDRSSQFGHASWRE